MKDFHDLTTEYSDEVLCAMAQEGDLDAEETLVLRYQRQVRMCARPFFLAGGDSEDLIQEAMFGLIKAIREFDPNRDIRFRTFADVCIRNRIRSAITSALRGKHTPLNDSVPFESMMGESDSSPEELFISQEEREERMAQINHCLSPLEQRVFAMFLQGLSYQEISIQVGRSVKSVDNAVQRIRRKVAPYYGDISRS
ncbi:hypothetical protein B5G37_14050 [Pseudoflavonifractor sp. An85]|nr:hypothetical protein B5G37_14050 [Pseudoflavonifractor sp. An85]